MTDLSYSQQVAVVRNLQLLWNPGQDALLQELHRGFSARSTPESIDKLFLDAWDLDEDGYPRIVSGALVPDCSEGNRAVHPEAPDPPNDGRDTDCDHVDGVLSGPTKLSDLDWDHFTPDSLRGSVGADCSEGEVDVNPDAFDPLGDRRDTNCDYVDGEGPGPYALFPPAPPVPPTQQPPPVPTTGAFIQEISQ